MPRLGTGLPLPRLTVRDATAEAVAGIVQRPGRAGLTMLGTVLGVGAFVAVLGLTATGAGQISRQFSVLEDTTVTVADNGPANDVAAPGTYPAIGFPPDADAIADHIRGVAAGGCLVAVPAPGEDGPGGLRQSGAGHRDPRRSPDGHRHQDRRRGGGVTGDRRRRTADRSAPAGCDAAAKPAEAAGRGERRPGWPVPDPRADQPA